MDDPASLGASGALFASAGAKFLAGLEKVHHLVEQRRQLGPDAGVAPPRTLISDHGPSRIAPTLASKGYMRVGATAQTGALRGLSRR
jgi:hypothetical protein